MTMGSLLTEKLEEVYKDFVQEIIDESRIISADEINPSSLRRAFYLLDEHGFDYTEAVVYTNELAYEEVHGVPVLEDSYIPDETAIILHPKSLGPTPPEVVEPAVVVHPEGIITLKGE